jgi:mRNA interferase RelE/StbE
MLYTVIIPKKVQKEINRIDKRYQAKIKTALAILANDPYSGKKLEGDYKSEWSFRVWPYRIIYQIENHQMIVLVIKVGHRQGVYK